MVIAVAVLLCVGGVASPQVAAAATAGQLSFGEPGTQRSIVLVPCTTASSFASDANEEMETGVCEGKAPPDTKRAKGEHPKGNGHGGETSEQPRIALVGRLTLAIHNPAAKSVRFRLHYVRADGSQVRLPGESSYVHLVGQPAPSKRTLRLVERRLTSRLRRSSFTARVADALRALGLLSLAHPTASSSVKLPSGLERRTFRALRVPVWRVKRVSLDRLSTDLTGLVAPRGSGVKLTRGEVRRLLDDLQAGLSLPRMTSDTPVTPATLARLVGVAGWLFRLVSARATVAVAPHATVVLPLRFMPLSPSGGASRTAPAAPSALDGTIIVEPTGSATEPIELPVVASTAEPDGVQLERSEVTLTATSFFSRYAARTVALVGPGIEAFLASADARPRSFSIHNDGGGVARLRLGRFTQDPGDPARATARLTVVNHPPPGQYHDKAWLAEFAPGSSRLQITLLERLPFWFAWLLVFIGVVFGDLAERIYALNAQRRALSKALRESFDKLERTPWQEPAAWNVTKLVESAHALQREVDDARSDKDIRESNDAAFDLIARLNRWLRLEPPAERLASVANLPIGTMADRAAWHKSQTWRETRRLQLALKREPQGVPAADDLVARVLWQIDWHRRLAGAWKATKGDESKHAEVTALDESLKDKDLFARSAGENDALGVSLDVLREELGLAKTLAMPELETHLGVDWSLDPETFKGFAPFDGTQFAHVRAKVERPALRLKLAGAQFKLQPEDLLWTLLPVAAICIVYTLAAYSTTWGSLKDVLTALSAGLVGKVAIDWAKLPLFRSRRLLRSTPATTTESTGS